MAADPTATDARQPRPLLVLLAANAVSLTGNQMTGLAVPWFVLETTGSAARTGVVASFAILPIVPASFVGGAVVDRLGFKRASVGADLASGGTVALIPLLHAAGLLEFWVLLLLVFLGALLDAPGATARRALVPDLAALRGMGIERASASLQVVERTALLLGAPIGGALVALIGPTNVLWLDAATFGLSATAISVGVPTIRHERPPGGEGGERLALAAGFRFIRGDRLILAVALTLTIANLLDEAWASVVAPVYAREVYGSAVSLGLLFGASGGGAVAGALLFGAIGHRLRRRVVFIAGFVVVGAPFLLMATLPPLPVALAIQAVRGFAAGPLNPILSAIQYERIPAAMRGRVLGATTASAFAAMPLGALLGGALIEGAGLRATLLAIGGCYVATTLTLIVNPAIRGMDRGREGME